jgi:hypothetical protein
MRHMVLFDTQYRALLVASLISSCLLMGCESNFHLERFYKPAATLEGASAVTLQPRPTPPQLAYSHDPDGVCCPLDQPVEYASGALGTSYFASYWAKSDPANTSRSN